MSMNHEEHTERLIFQAVLEWAVFLDVSFFKLSNYIVLYFNLAFSSLSFFSWS